MALLGTLVLGVVVWLEERALEERARVAGSQLETLAHATSSYVNSDFPDLLASVGVGRIIVLQDMRNAGMLPEGFAVRNALGRGFQVMMRPVGTRGLDVLVAETLPGGDQFVPSVALLGERFGGVRMGVVAPEAPTFLRGPTIDVAVGGFQTQFGGVPGRGALGVLMRFDHERVYGDQLYRVAIPGFDEANQMKTALDLGGNDIVDVRRLEAESFDVEEDIETGGELVVTGLLTVGQAVEVTGEATIAGEMSAQTGNFDQTVTATTMEALKHIEAETVTATGTLTGKTVTATGTMTADSAVMGNLQSRTMDASAVSATSVTAEIVGVDTLGAAGHMTADSAGISRLTVGSCSGC